MSQGDAEPQPETDPLGLNGDVGRFKRRRWPLLKVKVHPQIKLRLHALVQKSMETQEVQAMAAKALRIGIKALEKRQERRRV